MIVVYTTSHNVDQYLPTALNSLFTHNPDAFVYIIAEDEHIDCIKRTLNIKIIPKSSIPDFPLTEGPNIGANAMQMSRCWLPQILTEDKVLYLDIDTFVLDNLDDLWNMDMTDCAIAAWPEDRDDDLIMDWCMPPRREMKYSKYINSGVVLFNLKYIRENGIDKKWLSILKNKKLPLPDQDAINLACDGHIKYLDTIYNFGNINYKNVPPIEDAKIYHMLNYKFWNNQNSGYKYYYLSPKYYAKELYEPEVMEEMKMARKDKLDISIIVPCKNIEEYIKNLLLSFHMINLVGIKYEILFVLDDESDKTADVINQYMFGMDFKILYSHSTYVSMARNYGLERAKGEYIWFIDGDDWIINPEVIQQVLNRLRQNPSDNIMQIDFVSNYFNMKHYSMVWQYIFKAEFIKKFHFLNVRFQEDNHFMMEVLTKNEQEQIPYLQIPSYFYNYRRPGSNTHLSLGIDV